MAVEAPLARHDTSIFVHQNKLLVLPNTRGACSSVVVLYPDSGRYQLYALDYLNKVPALHTLCPRAASAARSHLRHASGAAPSAPRPRGLPAPAANAVLSIVGSCAGDQRAGSAQVRH